MLDSAVLSIKVKEIASVETPTSEAPSITAAVQLTCTWGRTPLPVSTSPQVSYLLVDAQPLSQPARPVPLNFCLVLDRSGSMQGQKLTQMKAATRRVIATLTPEDVVAIVVFDDTVDVVLPAMPAADQDALLSAIERIQEQGGTAMSLGLEAGMRELQKHASPDRLSAMLVLTDGQTWGDEDTCRTLATTLGTQGVRITALGLGDEWNEQLLDDLADATQGTSDYIAQPEQIGDFFQRAVQQVQGIAITQARLLLRLVRDVSPRAVYRVVPKIANLGATPMGLHEVSVNLGDLTFGTGASVLAELMVPTRTVGSFRIAQAELHFTPVGASPQVLKQDVMLDFVADAQAAQYTPQVMNTVEKVTAFKLQTRALEEAEVGNMSGATQKLRAAATRLLDIGELELAEVTRQQADDLERGAGLNTQARKELRYATRRLTQRLLDA